MQFIALYKFYYQDLYAYGVSLGFNTEDVKDAIQEVYLKLYFNERLCIDEKKIKFYLLRSVRNQLIDWERTKKDTSSIEEEERSFKLSVSVEESFISDEEDLLLKKRVNRILDLLTDHQREIVYLHFIEEMPYEEIAVMLDMKCILLVRGKIPTPDMITLARTNDIVLLSTMYKMYTTCGILYENGLGSGEYHE